MKPEHWGRASAGEPRGKPEQGTVAEFDPGSQAGSVLRDDGTSVAFEGPAFATSGLRFLRPGQRVRIDRDGDGRVVRVTLVTLS